MTCGARNTLHKHVLVRLTFSVYFGDAVIASTLLSLLAGDVKEEERSSSPLRGGGNPHSLKRTSPGSKVCLWAKRRQLGAGLRGIHCHYLRPSEEMEPKYTSEMKTAPVKHSEAVLYHSRPETLRQQHGVASLSVTDFA
ncbi:unnamed protein product [Gadus morhua 'NCC']